MIDDEKLMQELLTSTDPIELMDACKRVAKFILGEFNDWSAAIRQNNQVCVTKHGRSVCPADPILGGLLLALIHVVMEPENQDGIVTLGKLLNIPEPAAAGVRRRLNELFDDLGIKDNMHLLNYGT